MKSSEPGEFSETHKPPQKLKSLRLGAAMALLLPPRTPAPVPRPGRLAAAIAASLPHRPRTRTPRPEVDELLRQALEALGSPFKGEPTGRQLARARRLVGLARDRLAREAVGAPATAMDAAARKELFLHPGTGRDFLAPIVAPQQQPAVAGSASDPDPLPFTYQEHDR